MIFTPICAVTEITPNWQQALAKSITSLDELCRLLELDSQKFAEFIDTLPKFPLRVPRGFVARMQKGNLRDPLLMQVLPLQKELEFTTGFCQDPIQEKNANPLPGLLHKYPGRVLLIATGACAVHCRYCFRREFPYEENVLANGALLRVLEYIRNDLSIEEVILSGGDPLIFKDSALSQWLQNLAAIPHVKIVRFHSRIPVVLPERITPELISILTASRLRPVIVIHCNHPQELDDLVKQCLTAMHKAGITLLNQAVLLRDINNQVDILSQLNRQLFNAGVLPYYLHLLDPVQGAAHFSVSADEGKQLIQQLRDQLPGYLVPKLAQEIAGKSAKVTLS